MMKYSEDNDELICFRDFKYMDSTMTTLTHMSVRVARGEESPRSRQEHVNTHRPLADFSQGMLNMCPLTKGAGTCSVLPTLPRNEKTSIVYIFGQIKFYL